MFECVPLRRSRCRRENTRLLTRFKEECKLQYTSGNCIYMSRRFSRLNCPAKQPHIFESNVRVQTRNVIICIHVHCFNYVPFSRATDTQYYKLLIYPLHAMSCLANLGISHMTPPFTRFDLESLQLDEEKNHVDDGPPVSSTG